MKALFKKYKPYYKESLLLAFPVIFSQLGFTIVQTADTIIVGRFAGTIPLAAVSLAGSVLIILLLIGIGIAYGITPLIAQLNGRQEHEECGMLLSNGLFINVLTGALLFGFSAAASQFLLGHLHQSKEVVRQARPFLLITGLSLLPMLVFTTFKQFAEGLGFTFQAMLISIAGNIINIVLGVIFVKGLFGITPMGIRGVGYSTLIDRIVMAVVMMAYVLRSVHFKKYLLKFSFINVSLARCQQILHIGLPVAMQYVFEIGAFSSAAVIIGTISYYGLAAHQIAINLASLTYMMASGLSAAAAIKTGNYFGGNDHLKLQQSAIANYHIVIVFMSVTAVFFFIGHGFLPAIYTPDSHVITIASQLLLIAAFFQLFDGTQVVGLGILRGMGDVKIPTQITFIAYWIVALPIAYLLGIVLNFGVTGVWCGLVLGLMTSAILVYLRFRYLTRYNLL